MQRGFLGFALGALVAVASLGAGMAIRNDGLEFPDGSVQTTAPLLPAATAVQGEGNANIPEFEFCSGPQVLYAVPAGQRLAIEWVSVEIASLDVAEPIDVDITTRSVATALSHPLVRLTDSTGVGPTIFASQRWNSPVRLYSDAGQNVEISACRDSDVGELQLVTVTFSGHLVDVT